MSTNEQQPTSQPPKRTSVDTSSEVLLAYWIEQRQQLRQSEDQRSAMTNYLLVITAGLTGLIVAQKFTLGSLPLAALIVVIGLYGALTSMKYHERATYHLHQARGLTQTLIDLGVLDQHDRNIEAKRQAHYAAYPRLSKIRLHLLWTGLHAANATFGAVLTAVILIR